MNPRYELVPVSELKVGDMIRRPYHVQDCRVIKVHEWVLGKPAFILVEMGKEQFAVPGNADVFRRIPDNVPEFTPVALKWAEEIELGDIILASGWIRTVTRIDPGPIQRIIHCGGWMAWFTDNDLVAVLPRPLVEKRDKSDEPSGILTGFEGGMPVIEHPSAPDEVAVLRRAIEIAIGDEYIGSPKYSANRCIDAARAELTKGAAE